MMRKNGVHASGPGRFITKIVTRPENEWLRIETSRRDRKGMGPVYKNPAGTRIGRKCNPWLCFFAPKRLAWWIAVTFICGSSLFSYGPSLFLFPWTRFWVFRPENVNYVFLFGSFFFTTASYLQYYEMLNADKGPKYFSGQYRDRARIRIFFGWEPGHLAFWACFTQFIGTLFFNLDCFCAVYLNQGALVADLTQWLPSVIGSILFVVSAYLVFMEVGHSYFSLRIRSVSWWVAFVNLLGCLGFLVGSAMGISLPGGMAPDWTLVTRAFNLQGALGFLISSYLMIPEMFSESV